MGLRWGYSPKVERYIPLGDFPADRYLIIAQQAIENLGWKLSHLSESGIIAYTGISFQSYSEEISIRIKSNFAAFKSECIGVQMLFTDYGKNEQNLDKFFHEFEYVEFHLKDIWEKRLADFHAHIALHDDSYLDLAPLKAKDKIKNVLYLFYPQKDYLVTPILVNLCVLYFLVTWASLVFAFQMNKGGMNPGEIVTNVYLRLGGNSRELVLSGEFWRLISSQFLHISFSHLFFNMYTLVYIGLMIENKLGPLSTAMVYLLSGICGSLLSVYTHHAGFMVGASGAIMGMFGAFLALLFSKAFEKSANKALLISTVILVAYMLLSGLTAKGIDNSAHFGGIISGFVIGKVLFTNELSGRKISIWLRRLAAIIIVLLFGAFIYLFSPNYSVKEYARLKWEFNKNDAEYYRLYQVSPAMSKDRQLNMVKQHGITVAERNLTITAQMGKLVLTERDKLDFGYRKIVARKEYRAAMLMYRDIKKGTMENRTEIQRLVNDLNRLKIELAGKLSKMKGN